ncbi:MAG: hypothetical protein Q8Q14_13345 [Gemmatimonadales bacterium]|nr:hypothetical protein [Gemmatimonadales bacterium]
MDQPLLTMLQYGAVGAIAVLAIAALAYVTRRYITHLERSDERWRQVLDAVTATIAVHERHEASRHDELLRAIARLPQAPAAGRSREPGRGQS